MRGSCRTSDGTSILGMSPQKSVIQVGTAVLEAYPEAPAATFQLLRRASYRQWLAPKHLNAD